MDWFIDNLDFVKKEGVIAKGIPEQVEAVDKSI